MENKLYDPITQEELTIFSMTGTDGTIDKVGTADRTGYLIRNLANHHNVDEAEMRRRLENSDIDNPIIYKDEFYWAEVE